MSPYSSAHSSSSSNATVDVVRITEDAEFAALREAWNRIAAESSIASIFLSHEWFDSAWAWRRLDSDLDMMVVRTPSQVIGILPTIRGKTATRRARTLQLLTVPDTQMSDVLAGAEAQARVADALAVALTRRRDWDRLELNYLVPDGGVLRCLAPALRSCGLRLENHDGGRNTFIELQGSWSDFYATRSRRLKKANNLAANRMKKAGEVRIERIVEGAADRPAAAAAIEAAIAISSRSWKQGTGNSLDQPGPRSFITRLSELSSGRGWMSLWLMHLQGRPVAMEYQLIDNGRVHALRSDFDRDCEDTSPGSYLFRHLLESSFGCGLLRYYMGPGDNAYKLRWTDQGDPLRRLIVYNRTLRGRLAWLKDGVVKPRLRDLRRKLTRHAEPVQASTDDKGNLET
jgi:CelD/BcsL family acetyltransferase involved in cellulose biosynthesis